MKKTTITFLMTGLLIISGVKAQSLQEGITHLNADRYKTAASVFEKLLATNPNNIEAIYWLGQTHLDNDENDKARQVYQAALQSTNNAPLILVGAGHVDLLDKKTGDARQKFETALTMTRTKKGDDPSILYAIGRGNVDAKEGDFNYAIEKLEAAVAKDPKNAEYYVQLGNAYRKAKPGEGGGPAYTNYNKALEINPNYAVASVRLAKLFETQKNWELYLKYLNDAATKEARFAPAYYELFYYYFYRAKFPEAEDQLKKYIESSDADVQNDFLYAQLCWARKDFGCAITKAEGVAAAKGVGTKPKVLKLLADAHFQKGDYTSAKKYIDQYFSREKTEDLISFDYKLKADILSKSGGTADDVLNAYMQGYVLDTVLTSKIDFLKQGVAYFKENKLRDKEALILEKIIELKPKPTINDYFDLTLAYYFSGNNLKSRETALLMRDTKFTDQVYGFEWAYNNSVAVDTVRKDSIAVPDALKLYEFSQKDTAKFRKNYLSSVRFLAAYYINVAKDKDKSLEFFTKWLEADSANAVTIQQYIDQIKKMPAKPPTAPKGNASPAGVKNGPKPAPTTKSKTITTANKPAAAKK